MYKTIKSIFISSFLVLFFTVVFTLFYGISYGNASEAHAEDFNAQMDHYQQELMLLSIKNKVSAAQLENSKLSQQIILTSQQNKAKGAGRLQNNVTKVEPQPRLIGNDNLQNIAVPKLIGIYGSPPKLYANLTYNNENLTVTTGDNFFCWKIGSLSATSVALVHLQTNQSQTIYL
jgi:hypothetical protein